MENHKQCLNRVHNDLNLLVQLSYNDPNNKVEIIMPNGERRVICPIFYREFAYTKDIMNKYKNIIELISSA